MTLFCRDSTNRKLFLALEFLSFLNALADQIQILCSEKSVEAYQPLTCLFENIRFSSKEKKLVQIEFTDDPHWQSQAPLVIPILQAEQLSGDIPVNWVPLVESLNFPGYLLPDIESAKDLVQKLTTVQDFAGRRLLISAGPTAEDLDPVRFMTNRSSGKMGLSLARAAFIRGADVQLVYGPGQEKVPQVLQTDFVRSAKEMTDQISKHFSDTDVYIATAAVADYTPVQVSTQKIKKSPSGLQLKMKRTSDILCLVDSQKTTQRLVGFSVETEHIIENSLKKLEQKNLDMIVINNPLEQGSGFGVDTNKVSVLLKNGQMYNLPLQSKQSLSYKLLDFILELVRSNV